MPCSIASPARCPFQRLLRLPEGKFQRSSDRIQDLVWESGKGLKQRAKLASPEHGILFEDAVIELYES